MANGALTVDEQPRRVGGAYHRSIRMRHHEQLTANGLPLQSDYSVLFLDRHGKEALNFQITIAIAYVAAIILTTITFGLLFFLPMLVWVGNLVFCILAAVKANTGETYRYPFALRLIK